MAVHAQPHKTTWELRYPDGTLYSRYTDAHVALATERSNFARTLGLKAVRA